MRRLAWLLLVPLAACAAPSPPGPGSPARPSQATTGFEQTGCSIQRVVDGDTIAIACPATGASNVRLTGFDTPETYRPRCAAERARGRLATRELRSLVARARTVDLRPSGTDRYGRVLARLYLDGVDVARHMVAQGLAVPYDGGRRRNWCA